MSEYRLEQRGARDEHDEAIEQRAQQLVELGHDWMSALAQATREVSQPAARGLRRMPGKVARTAGLAPRVAEPDKAAIQAHGASDDFADSPEARERIRRAAAQALAGAGGELPHLETIQRLFGHHDVSQVRAHTDGAAEEGARAMGAEAFAFGTRVAFAGTPNLFTAAHEAAHVVQQRAGVDVADGVGRDGDRYERHADQVAERVVRGENAQELLDGFLGPAPRAQAPRGPVAPVAPAAPIVQMRRLPPNVAALLTSTTGGDGANFDANADGVQRLIDRALAELTPAQRATVMTQRRATGSLTEAQFNALPRRDRLSRTVEAIRTLFPSLQQGDPALIDVGPTTAAQRANLATVVTNTGALMMTIIGGAHDTSLGQVFGTANIGTAKAKYVNAFVWMTTLHATNKIVTDRSGYNAEAGLGGLTGFQSQISVESSVIDSPNADGSIITLLHESMHAGNNDVTDNGYLGAPQFDTRSEPDKLTNAAHYEVPAWRIRAPTDAFAYPVVPATTPPTFQTFRPAGTTSGGVTAPTPTIPQRAVRAASEFLREAWTTALNLHMAYVKVFRTPSEWTAVQPDFGGMRFDNSLPFWSKVGKLTIHAKTTINPASADPAVHPVSQVDVALSEGLVRKLSNAMNLLNPVETDAQVRAFEAAHSSATELAAQFPGGAHTNADAERDFVLRLVLRDATIHPITGTVVRDVRVVKQMGDPANGSWSVMLAPRSPSSFAD